MPETVAVTGKKPWKEKGSAHAKGREEGGRKTTKKRGTNNAEKDDKPSGRGFRPKNGSRKPVNLN